MWPCPSPAAGKPEPNEPKNWSSKSNICYGIPYPSVILIWYTHHQQFDASFKPEAKFQHGGRASSLRLCQLIQNIHKGPSS